MKTKSDMENNIKETQRKRFLLLKELYDVSESDSFKMFDLFQLGKKLNLEKEEITKIMIFLQNEGLVELASGGSAAIKHDGIKEVEYLLNHPNESTDYFPALNIINIEHMQNSQIQQGTIERSQSLILSTNELKLVKVFIEELEKKVNELKLNNLELVDLKADMETIKSQLASSRPKRKTIVESIKTIRNIIEGASGSILASELIKHIPNLLQ